MANSTTDRIKFNVGGKIFETTSTTLAKGGKNSLLGALLDNQHKIKNSYRNREYFIDRNPKCFSVLLDLLRTGELDIPSTMNERLLYREALYYGLENHVRAARSDPFADNCFRCNRPVSGREPQDGAVVRANPISVNFQPTSKKSPYQKKKLGKNLVGSRIKVWWPVDNVFYEAVVASYNHVGKQHKIIYDDGDIENLVLDNERWEYAESSYTSESELSSRDGNTTRTHGSIVKLNNGLLDYQQKPVKRPGDNKLGEHLVGSKIKVWWPQEKAYYDAVVQSYYRGTNQHKVVYSDGDVELLVLENERWKFVENSDIDPASSKFQTKRAKTYHLSPSKQANGILEPKNSKGGTKSDPKYKSAALKSGTHKRKVGK